MIFPMGSSKEMWLDATMSANTYLKAIRLCQNEEFQAAKDLIDKYYLGHISIIDSHFISGEPVVSLYTRVLYYLKEFETLREVFQEFSKEEFESLPELSIVYASYLIKIGQSENAIQLCDRFIKSMRSPIEPIVGQFLSTRSFAAFHSGKMDNALHDLEIAHSILHFNNDLFEAALAANRAGMISLRTSHYLESMRWYNKAYEIYHRMGLNRKISMVLLNLGVLYYKSGNLQKSHTTLLESHKIGVDGGWIHRQVFTNIALGNVLRMQRDYESARKHLHTAYTQAQELGYPREEALALEFLGDVYRDEGLFDQAQRFHQRAMAIGEGIAPVGDIVMECHRRIGECQAGRGELGDAVQSLNKCILLARAQGDRYEEGVALRVHGLIKMENGGLEKADEFITNSVEILEEIGARYELAVSLQTFADLKLRQVDRGTSPVPDHLLLAQAWSHVTKALDHAIFTGVAPLIENIRALSDRISRMRNGLEVAGKDQGKRRRVPKHVIIHQSQVMRDLIELADMFASTEEPVLITGETGTGKELIARRLHVHSGRASNKLVSVNVTAIPATMFEREMFGHVKGSFSGAERDSIGFVGEAEGGTLFLDEIGDLPAEMQPKLLRLLQEGTYQKLGDPTERQADIRIVAATNSSLKDKVATGEFRSDLYFRLKVLGLELPPLRDRVGDVALLMNHFLSEAAGKPVDMSSYFDEDSIDFLDRHDWPGNIRELGMLAKRAHVERSTRGTVRIAVDRAGEAPFILKSGEVLLAREAAEGSSESRVPEIETTERVRIQLALEQCGGNRVEAAEKLRMGRSTLYRKMKKYGI